MKYIIFKDNKSDLIHTVIFPDSTTHSQIKIENAKPMSAGFFTTIGKLAEAYGKSDSLKLKCGPMDSQYITSTLLNSGTSVFLDFNNLYCNPYTIK